MSMAKKYWKVGHDMALTLESWDRQCRSNLSNVKDKIPKLNTSEKLTAIDIGGNTGTFVEMLLEDTPYEFDKILLFEPVPLYARWASFKFCNLNENPKVDVIECALSDERKEQKIAVNNYDSNLGWNTMVDKWQKEETSDIILVQSFTFDEIFSHLDIKKIDLIKIDVEGYEAKVLKGMTKTLEGLDNKPPMIVEIADGSRHHDMENLEAEFSKLENIGYSFDDKKKWPDQTFDLLMN